MTCNNSFKTDLKDIRETKQYPFDFTSQLNGVEAISSYTVNLSGLILDGDSIDSSTVTVTVSGGTANTTGFIEVEVETDQANTYIDTLSVTILDGAAMAVSEVDVVRNYIGDSDPDSIIITDIEISKILYKYKACENTMRMYRTVIESLTYMKSLYAQSAFRSRDRELSTEVEEYGKERYESICDLLDYYKKHPEDILDPSSYEMSRIKIGGVRVDEYNQIASNPNSLNGIARIDRGSNKRYI